MSNNLPSTIADMVADALIVHEADGCCTPALGVYCDEAREHLLVHLERADAHQGPDAAAQALIARTAPVGHRPNAGAKAGNQYGEFKVKAASAAQVKFLTTCLATRDMSTLNERETTVVSMVRRAMEQGVVSKRLASSALDFLATAPLTAKAEAAAPQATRKANRFAGKCVRCGGWVAAEAGFLTKDQDGKWASEHNGECPAVEAAPVVAEVTESGIYRTADDTIYKVYLNQTKTVLLAKRLVLGTEGRLEGMGKKADWEYAGMAKRFVTPDQKMNLEQAKAFGRIYGVCCNCGAMLTDETSIENGIGPVCATRF